MQNQKVCPFCGFNLIKVFKHGSKKPGRVALYAMCRKCHARGPYTVIDEGALTPEEETAAAIEKWNTRC